MPPETLASSSQPSSDTCARMHTPGEENEEARGRGTPFKERTPPRRRLQELQINSVAAPPRGGSHGSTPHRARCSSARPNPTDLAAREGPGATTSSSQHTTSSQQTYHTAGLSPRHHKRKLSHHRPFREERPSPLYLNPQNREAPRGLLPLPRKGAAAPRPESCPPPVS